MGGPSSSSGSLWIHLRPERVSGWKSARAPRQEPALLARARRPCQHPASGDRRVSLPGRRLQAPVEGGSATSRAVAAPGPPRLDRGAAKPAGFGISVRTHGFSASICSANSRFYLLPGSAPATAGCPGGGTVSTSEPRFSSATRDDAWGGSTVSRCLGCQRPCPLLPGKRRRRESRCGPDALGGLLGDSEK